MPKMISYAQNGEDVWIVEHLPLPDKGFYVDIGAGHPFTTSNTAFLRDRKWEGLAFDGDLSWAHEWDGIPAFQHAVVTATPGMIEFYEFPGCGYYSRIGPDIIGAKLRECETIEQLLERFEVGKFDFLSIDTEGTELEILQSFDFEKHSPEIVIAEYNAAHLPMIAHDQSPIPGFMRSKGYWLASVFPPVNMVFIK